MMLTTLLVSLPHGSTKLTIVNKTIKSYAALIIGNFVKESKILQELKLSLNEFDDNALKLIIEALQINSTLWNLEISFNEISYDGALFIDKCLKHHKPLKILHLIEGVKQNKYHGYPMT